MFFPVYLCSAKFIPVKNKKWLLLLIIALPSLLWIILETSTINSHKLPYYGPKTVKGPKDTSYHTVNSVYSVAGGTDSSGYIPYTITQADYPVYMIMFVKDNYSSELFRMAGLMEYLNYNKQKIEQIPFFLVTESANGFSKTQEELAKLTKNNENVKYVMLTRQKFDSLNTTHFIEKPYFIDVSFLVMVDNDRHVRGYYDGRFAAEVKRLEQEYKHLRLKEEKQRLLKENEIKSGH